MSDGDVTSNGRARLDALLEDAHETLPSEDSGSALLDVRILGVDT